MRTSAYILVRYLSILTQALLIIRFGLWLKVQLIIDNIFYYLDIIVYQLLFNNHINIFRWIKDGVDIGPASQGNGSLSLGGVRRETGSYQCSATVPDIGTILSRAAKVTFAGALI